MLVCMCVQVYIHVYACECVCVCVCMWILYLCVHLGHFIHTVLKGLLSDCVKRVYSFSLRVFYTLVNNMYTQVDNRVEGDRYTLYRWITGGK